MTDCPFCNNGQDAYGEVVLANSFAYVITSQDSVLKTAAMLIPKRHITTPFDFNSDEWAAVHELMYEAKTYLDRDEPDGYSIGWNVGKTAGQHVEHVHLHIIGRFADEPLAGKGIRYFFKQKSNKRPS